MSAVRVCTEDLDFARAPSEGREHTGRRASRGGRGRRFRAQVAGIPTGRFRDRLAQMAANRGLFVIAVDPAYTSRWGAKHWFDVYPTGFTDGRRAPLRRAGHRTTWARGASTATGRM